MTVQTILVGATATQTIAAAPQIGSPAGTVAPQFSTNNINLAAVVPYPAGQNSPSYVTYTATVSAVAGTTVSATIQPIGSNDGINWVNDGATIAISSGTAPQSAAATVNSVFPYRSAYLTAISGTGAKVSATVNQ
jgi:hypothetical protein